MMYPSSVLRGRKRLRRQVGSFASISSTLRDRTTRAQKREAEEKAKEEGGRGGEEGGGGGEEEEEEEEGEGERTRHTLP